MGKVDDGGQGDVAAPITFTPLAMNRHHKLSSEQPVQSLRARRDQQRIADLLIQVRLEQERADSARRERDLLHGEVKRLQGVIREMNSLAMDTSAALGRTADRAPLSR